jgi:hypothetical protein
MIHRRVLPVLIVACFICLLGTALAQSKKSRGPRALALVEVAPNNKGRVIPIAILVDGKYYDAGLYKADPQPMAVAPETVYEAQRTGDPVGLFTITAAQELKGNWYGVGQFRPTAASEPEGAPKEVNLGGKKTDTPKSGDDEDRPILKRPAAEDKTAETPAPATEPKASAKPDEQPKTAPAPQADDSGRPVLRRGKPGEEQADQIPSPDTLPAKPTVAQTSVKPDPKTGKLPPPTRPEYYAAISDAGPSGVPQSFAYDMTYTQRQNFTEKMSKLASDVVRQFAGQHREHVPAGTFSDFRLHVFDLNYSNEPVLVFSASVPAQTAGAKNAPAANSDFQYYVTLVARETTYGELRQLFLSVTDSSHLDAYPRLELIDAIDADGNKMGELLFREVYDRSRSFALYRAGMDQLYQLFEGGQSPM